jgi:hypothetical protein
MTHLAAGASGRSFALADTAGNPQSRKAKDRPMKNQPQSNEAIYALPGENDRHAKSPPKPGRPGAVRTVLCALAILGIALAPEPARSENAVTDDVSTELTALGERGALISRVREQTFGILDSENACSAWFREVAPDTAEVFESLHYEIEREGPSYVQRMRNTDGTNLFKHPWTARTTENSGRDSTIVLNPSGAFFRPNLPLVNIDRQGGREWMTGDVHRLAIASYSGNTARAQITTLLHELGHVVGRLPEDDDSWNGRSTRNTEQVLRHCKHEIHAAAERVARNGQEKIAYHLLP